MKVSNAEACDGFRDELRRQVAGQAPRRIVVYEGNGTAGIGDRIKSFLNIATLAAAAFATLAVPAPCELLESAHLCRVQLQAGLTPQGCATRSPALPCAWGWSRYIELQPPALIDFHDLPPSLAGLERALERLPQLHPIKGAAQGAAKGTAEAAEAEAGAKAESPVSSGHTLHSAPYTAVPSSREGGSCAGCTADLAQSQPTTMVASSRPQQGNADAHTPRPPLLWRLSPLAAATMLPSLPKHAVTCLPVAQPGAAVRALRDRFVLMHGLRAAVAEAPATTSFSLTTSPSLSHPLPSSSSSSPSSLSSSSSRYYHAFHIRRQGCDATMADVEAVALQLRNTTAAPAAAPVRTLLLFTDEPASPFLAAARAVLARHFPVILLLDEQIAIWQREADGGRNDNYMLCAYTGRPSNPWGLRRPVE